MKSTLNTTFSLLVSAADHLDRQAALHRIRRKNKAQRGVRNLGQMTGGDAAALSDWLAGSQRAVLFAHGLRTSELLSENLGLCDQLEAVHTKAGNNVLGRLGYNFGRQSAITTVARRERVVAPEELVRLGPNGFILLDNTAFSPSRGTLR